MVVLVFGGLAFTELAQGHVDVDLVVHRFAARGRALCEAMAALLSAAFWGGIAWRTALRAIEVHAAGETTSTLLVPVAPFMVAAAAGSGAFALALLVRMLGACRRVAAP
jgi:TRAP-type C4-dicarboxylate transport system permease small subunit